MPKLNCPVCKEPYPRWKLILPRWYVVCPNCNSKLSLPTKIDLLIGLILGLSFAIAIIILTPEKVFSTPVVVYLMLATGLFGRFLIMIFAQFVKLPDKPGFLPIPRSSKYALGLIIVGALIIIIVVYIYNSSMLRPKPKMPESLKKAETIINSGLFSKSLFWINSKLGSITDIRLSNNSVSLAGTKGFVSLDKNLNLLTQLEFNACSSHTDIVFSDNDIYGFINRGNFHCDAAFFDRNGKAVWTYRGDNIVFDMTAGNIESDGSIEFVVGLGGSGGVHLLNKDGKKILEKPDNNVWHVELDDVNSDGFLEIVHSNANGQIVVRDRHGEIISKNKSSPYVSEFSLAKWPVIKDGECILLSADDKIWLLDFNGNVIAVMDAPKVGTLGHARGVSVKFKNEQPEYFAVIVEFALWNRSILYIYNHNKEIVYQEIFPEACASIASDLSDKSSSKSASQILLIGCKGKIWQYKKGV